MNLQRSIQFAAALAMAATFQTQSFAGESEPTEAVEPRVIESLTAMKAYFSDAESLTFRAWTTTEDVSSTLQKLQFDTTVRGVIQRPDKIFIERSGNDSGSLWYDGSVATVLDKDQNKYVKIPVSGGIDKLVDKLEAMGIDCPMADLLRGGLLEHVKKQVFKGDFYADVLLGETVTNQLALRQDAIDWQLWLDKDTSAPRKLVITSKMLAGAPQHQVFFKELEKNPKIPDGAFAPNLPAEAVEVPLADNEQLSNQSW